MKRFRRQAPSTDQCENREFASEIKFRVSPTLADQIRDWARGRLAPDPNVAGESGDAYPITSLYFDTDQFDVFHRKGSFGRSKYRVRRYGESQIAFLETLLGSTLDLHVQERELISVATSRQGVSLDIAYETRLRRTASADELVKALNRTEGVQSVQLQRRDFDQD